VRDRLEELGDNTTVALITFTDPTNVIGYSDQHDLTFPILVDPSRAAYRSFGLGRGSVASVWGWRAARRYYELYRTEGLASWRRPTEDSLQLGGDFVIGPNGSLVYGFWGDGPDDRPSVDDLVDALHRIPS